MPRLLAEAASGGCGDDDSGEDDDGVEHDERLVVRQVEHGDREPGGVDHRVERGVEEPGDQHVGAGGVVQPAQDEAAGQVRQQQHPHEHGGERPRAGIEDEGGQVNLDVLRAFADWPRST
jgi:hypothetical protein